MQAEHTSPQFDSSKPLGSALAVARNVLFSPRSFFLGFESDGETREPLIYAAIIGLVGAVLSFALGPVFQAVFGSGTGDEVYGLGLIPAVAFAVLYPAFVALSAAVYLLVLKVFVGGVGEFRQLFGMCAYGFTAMVLAWLPFVGALAITYALLITMVVGIRYVFSTTLTTALVVSVTSFVPLALALVALRGFLFQIFGG